MSITKEDNGSYTVYYTKLDVITNKKKRTKKRGFKTLKEAKNFARTVSCKTSDVTFYSLFEELQKTIEQENDTYLGKKGMIVAYLPALSNMRYEDITKSYLLQLRIKISELDKSATTKNKILRIIKATCKYANEIYDLPNYAKVLKPFKENHTKIYEIWSLEEYNAFETALKEKYPKFVPFFHLLYYTGLRKGEARALTVNDLDIDNKTIMVTKSMRKYQTSLKQPKTNAGYRIIRLDDKTFELLKPLKSNEKYLFGDYKPLNRSTISKAFDKSIEIAKVKRIRIHDLRHSHASYLISNGADVVAISKRLGHKSVNTTLEVYTHMIKKSEDNLLKILNNQ